MIHIEMYKFKVTVFAGTINIYFGDWAENLSLVVFN